MNSVDKKVVMNEFESVEDVSKLKRFESKDQLKGAIKYLLSEKVSYMDLKKVNLGNIYSAIELYGNGDRFELDSKYLELFNKKHDFFNQ